jgi:hypothetical protein
MGADRTPGNPVADPGEAAAAPPDQPVTDPREALRAGLEAAQATSAVLAAADKDARPHTAVERLRAATAMAGAVIAGVVDFARPPGRANGVGDRAWYAITAMDRKHQGLPPLADELQTDKGQRVLRISPLRPTAFRPGLAP